MKKKKKIWLKVSNDGYELPLAVADSAPELAKITGADVKNIRSAVSNWKAGRKKFSTFICVEVESEEE